MLLFKLIFIETILIIETTQFNTLPDEHNAGLVFQLDSYVDHQVFESELNFVFNISFLNLVRKNLSSICTENSNELKYIENTLDLMDMNWNSESERYYESRRIEVIPNTMHRLKLNLHQLPHVVCGNLENISNDLVGLYNMFRKLKDMNINDIINLIPIAKIKYEAFSSFKKYSRQKFSVAFRKDDWFFRGFIKQVTTETYYSNGLIHVILKFPIFENRRSSLYRVYAKPIIRYGDAYLYKNEVRIVLMNDDIVLPFTVEEKNKYCFYALNKIFCKNFTRTTDFCDEKYLLKVVKNEGEHRLCK